MPSAARHAKPTPPATRRRAPLAAAATLTGVAAAFVFLQSGSAAPRPARDTIAVTGAASGLTGAEVTTAVVRDITAAKADMAARQAARRKHIAQQRAARRRAAQRRAAQQAAAQPPPPSAAPAPPSSGGDAAHSPLGICIRNAEEGGSYAWTRQRRRCLPVRAEHLGSVRRCGQPVRRRRPRLPGSDIRQRHRRRWRVELDQLRRVLTARHRPPRRRRLPIPRPR